MPAELDSVDQLHSYLGGVIANAEHHAQNVSEVLLALAGAVVLFKDQGTSLEAFERRGNIANVLWATINGQRYAFTYDHDLQRVNVKRGSTQGQVVGSFNNQTPTSGVIDLFRGLRDLADPT